VIGRIILQVSMHELKSTRDNERIAFTVSISVLVIIHVDRRKLGARALGVTERRIEKKNESLNKIFHGIE